ncbi:hypothetical protein IWW38_005632, partial [Coemansia aciculifera]
RKEDESTFGEKDATQPQGQPAALQRLKSQLEQDASFSLDSSANTTDIEDELERQEAGLDEHEAEIDDFVQTIDWDDLEREAMEDSESDYGSDHSQPPSPDTSNSRTQSRAGSSPSLRNAALIQATQKQQRQKQSSNGRSRSKSRTRDGVLTDSSDVYADSSSGCSSEGEDGDVALDLAERHRMKRRKTSPDSTKQRRVVASRRRSKLAENDGSLDIGTNTEDSEADANDSSEPSSRAKSGDMRKRLADKLGTTRKTPSILDEDIESQHSNSYDDGYEDDGQYHPDASLFEGVEDRPAVGFENNADDDNEFEDVASDDESQQWGEDDDDDDENFDDLINNLEEEISST